jgi:hypothetical protein
MLTNQEIAEARKKYSFEGFLKRHPSPVKAISLSELETECHTFEAWEPRDSMYRVSTFLVREWWGDPAKLVDALPDVGIRCCCAMLRYVDDAGARGVMARIPFASFGILVPVVPDRFL